MLGRNSSPTRFKTLRELLHGVRALFAQIKHVNSSNTRSTIEFAIQLCQEGVLLLDADPNVTESPMPGPALKVYGLLRRVLGSPMNSSHKRPDERRDPARQLGA